MKKDVEDKRCSPFLHVLSLLNDAKTVPKIILVENVAGFESSLAHTKLIDVLNKRGYVYQVSNFFSNSLIKIQLLNAL